MPLRVAAPEGHDLPRTWTAILLFTLLAPAADARPNLDLRIDADAHADLAIVAEATARARGRLDVTWDWGDGTCDEGIRARHEYARAGVYRVVVTATDAAGRTWRETREVDVRADAELEHDDPADARSHTHPHSHARARTEARAEARVDAGLTLGSLDVHLGTSRDASADGRHDARASSEMRLHSNERRDSPAPTIIPLAAALAGVAWVARRMRT